VVWTLQVVSIERPEHHLPKHANRWKYRLAPKYEELAKIYAENPEYASKVTVAKIDATNNDVPDTIQGFPTIKLFPAGSKDSPVEYAGSRTIEDLAKFIKEAGKHQVDAVAEASGAAESGDVTSAASEATESETPAPAADEEAAAEHDEL
jgi:protein disulfide-isomerase A1